MKKFRWVAGAFLILTILVAAELSIISNATNHEVKERVVFAKKKIKKNTLIESSMLEIREVSSDAVHPEALRNIESALSKIACQDIEAGEMLLNTKLLNSSHGIIEAEDKNKRLFTVEFKGDQANGWQLVDGQYVDIIFVPNYEDCNVEVLKKIRIAGIIDEDGRLVDSLNREMPPRYVSFEVTEEQAEFLARAKRKGTLDLASVPWRGAESQ